MNKDSAVEPVFWSVLTVGEWSLHLAATAKGLLYIGSQKGSIEEMTAWVKRHYPRGELLRDDERLQPYAAELSAYLLGEATSFTFLQDPGAGTPFQREVWQALRKIPYGETCSYSDIAAEIGRPAAVRAVGAAIGANPLLITVPCHRVVGKSGGLTGYRGGLEMKTRLLELEKGRRTHANLPSALT